MELFCNNVSQGIRTAEDDFCWRVKYISGKLRAVGRSKEDKYIEDTVFTSGKVEKIQLTSYFGKALKANGKDLEYIKCELLDSDDRQVLNAELPIIFTISGPGNIAALDNGNQISCESFQNTNIRHSCAGRCLCIVRSKKKEGKIRLKAEIAGLCQAEFILSVKTTS